MRVVDAEHVFDEDGHLPDDVPAAAYRLAVRVAQCIEYGGPLPPEHMVLTLIECRRRPAGQPCRGTLVVAKLADDRLHALCAECDVDELLIDNWQSTLFAKGPPVALPLAPPTEQPPLAALPAEVHGKLERALAAIGSELSPEAVQRLIAQADQPTDVIRHIMASGPAPSRPAAEKLMEAMMAAWNTTPRAELGGRSPEQMFHESRRPVNAPAKVGRNQPCPCGSGQKFKRCCGAVN